MASTPFACPTHGPGEERTVNWNPESLHLGYHDRWSSISWECGATTYPSRDPLDKPAAKPSDEFVPHPHVTEADPNLVIDVFAAAGNGYEDNDLPSPGQAEFFLEWMRSNGYVVAEVTLP